MSNRNTTKLYRGYRRTRKATSSILRWFLRNFVAALHTALLVLLFTICATLLIPSYFLQKIPNKGLRTACMKYINFVSGLVSQAMSLGSLLQKEHINFTGSFDAGLKADENVIVVSNHVAWGDSFYIHRKTRGILPERKFVYKYSLRFIPIIGMGLRALNFIPVERVSLAKSKNKKKNQELLDKTQSWITAVCQQVALDKATVVIYLEGTRATKEKLAKSKLKNLLPPKVHGLKSVYSNMPRVNKIINVTVSYRKPRMDFWYWLGGGNCEVCLHSEVLDIPQEIQQAKANKDDKELILLLKAWMKDLWEEKDARIDKHHGFMNREQNREKSFI